MGHLVKKYPNSAQFGYFLKRGFINLKKMPNGKKLYQTGRVTNGRPYFVEYGPIRATSRPSVTAVNTVFLRLLRNILSLTTVSSLPAVTPTSGLPSILLFFTQ
jgi:hypothetical protein